jgi:hypothetical protein
MNLTPEELQFFRAQRLAASTEAIAFNYALCGQLLAVIPAQQLPGTAFPVPLATMTHMELNAWKDLLIQFFDGKNCYAQMLPILAAWKPDTMAAPPCTTCPYGPSKGQCPSSQFDKRIPFGPQFQLSNTDRLSEL